MCSARDSLAPRGASRPFSSVADVLRRGMSRTNMILIDRNIFTSMGLELLCIFISIRKYVVNSSRFLHLIEYVPLKDVVRT